MAAILTRVDVLIGINLFLCYQESRYHISLSNYGTAKCNLHLTYSCQDEVPTILNILLWIILCGYNALWVPFY